MPSTIEGIIPTLFGGVSRQPAQVRQPNQMQELTNGFPSVVTGGFEKRPNTQYVADITALNPALDWKTHGMDRSATDHVFICITGGTAPAIVTFDADTGAALTTVIGDTIREFLIDQTGIDNTNIVEVEGVDLQKHVAFASGETAFAWTYELSDASTVFKVEGSIDGSTWGNIAVGKTGASGSFSTTINAVATGDHNYIRFTITTAATDGADTISIRAAFQDLTYLLSADVEDMQLVSVADYTFITNRNITTRMGAAATGTLTSTVQAFTDLPSAAADSSIHKVVGKDTDGFGSYFVIDTTGPAYTETVDPLGVNRFDESSMPHQIVRSADGTTFTYSAATWTPREAGDAILNPPPGFIGGKVNDITFFRNRLGFMSDETVYLSQAGDVFNLFASKATDVLDSDPIERGATTEQINVLQFGRVFRKLLFLTSLNAQFEFESGEGRALTPETAELNQATSYRASALAKPTAMGDVLFFPSSIEGSAVLYEYFFQDTSFSNTATDVSRHVRTYIPTDILEMHADSAAQKLIVLTTGEQNAFYIYSTFFDSANKLQSAWSKYTFGASEAAAYIHGFHIFAGRAHILIERADGNIYLEVLPLDREEIATSMPYMPLLDQRTLLTGVYAAGTGLTTWTTVWDNNDDAQVVIGVGGTVPGHILGTLAYPTATTVTAVGDHSAAAAYVGRPFTLTAELSKIYPVQDTSPIVTGRLQLQDVTFLFEKTGHFEFKITADGRDSVTYSYEGKVLGGGWAVDDGTLLDSGRFRKKVMSNAETTKLEIISSNPQPVVITSYQWRGLFTETGRQG